ncbi:hypothetical protein BKA70DRAFT_1293226 [Coprinopsis sp. MPI-PUGE-AT-0042]|nr:hypothetical protein BKA70DRAFT_1293226 [Coprinopsis sp. MPI-PUGE-AT-0042]
MKIFLRAYGLVLGLLLLVAVESFARPVTRGMAELEARGGGDHSLERQARRVSNKVFDDHRRLIQRELESLLISREPQPGPTTWIKQTWAKTKQKLSRKPKSNGSQDQGNKPNPRPPLQTPLVKQNFGVKVAATPSPQHRTSFERPAQRPEGPRRQSPPASPRPLPAVPPRPLPAVPSPPKAPQGACACGICNRAKAQAAGC